MLLDNMVLFFIIISLSSAKTWGKQELVSKQDRNTYLQQMNFMEPGEFKQKSLAEIRNGPPDGLKLEEDETVYCRYKPRHNNGSNPKFRCLLTDLNNALINKEKNHKVKKPLELKVKYTRPKNSNPQKERDMYTEVFAARLLWSLGFLADRAYPVEKLVFTSVWHRK